MKAKVITITNHKGGVGKTTTAVNLAYALPRSKKKLLIDLDGQCNLSMLLPDNCENSDLGVYEMLSYGVKPDVSIIRDDIAIIPSNIAMSDIEVSLQNKIGREFILKRALEHYSKSYDYIIIDTPPALSSVCIAAMVASDMVLIPTVVELYSIMGIQRIIQTVSEIKERLDGSYPIVPKILVTRYASHTTVHKELFSQLKGVFDESLFLKTIIRQNIDLAKASAQSQSIFDAAPTSYGTQDYAELANEIEEVFTGYTMYTR